MKGEDLARRLCNEIPTSCDETVQALGCCNTEIQSQPTPDVSLWTLHIHARPQNPQRIKHTQRKAQSSTLSKP